MLYRVNLLRASLVAQKAKNLPAVQETCVQFLGPEDPLEEVKSQHTGKDADAGKD